MISKRFCGAAIAIGSALAFASPVRAQMTPTGEKPDVQVVVLPDPVTRQWMVGAAYPSVVKKSVMDGHIQRLIAISGWKASKIVFSEKPASAPANFQGDLKPSKKDPLMSGFSFRTNTPIVDWKDGTLPIETLARTFRDRTRVKATFILPNGFAFRGLRFHEDADLGIALTEFNGTYTYSIDIKNHKIDNLRLPRYQAVPSPESTRTANATKLARLNADKARQRFLAVTLVVVLAGIAGLGVYAWTHRLSGR